MELLFASANPHKIKEINSLIHDKPLKIKGLHEIGYQKEIPETGKTLEENALIKARHVYSLYNQPVFAEDTGLEIKALDFRPGVHTARYAGPEKDPINNMEKVLSEMAGVEDRSARFRAVIALIINDVEFCFEGIVNGRIGQVKKGLGGFGYDPIFIPENYTETFAELSPEIKNQFSHRTLALRKMLAYLQKKAYI
jgi:XTP/dITP diphosphohydrolase